MAQELRHLISDAPRVMVVDGSKLVRKLIADVLQREVPGVQVIGCSSIAEARVALEQVAAQALVACEVACGLGERAGRQCTQPRLQLARNRQCIDVLDRRRAADETAAHTGERADHIGDVLRLPVRAEDFVGDVAGRLAFHRVELARRARMFGEEPGAAIGELAQQ